MHQRTAEVSAVTAYTPTLGPPVAYALSAHTGREVPERRPGGVRTCWLPGKFSFLWNVFKIASPTPPVRMSANTDYPLTESKDPLTLVTCSEGGIASRLLRRNLSTEWPGRGQRQYLPGSRTTW